MFLQYKCFYVLTWKNLLYSAQFSQGFVGSNFTYDVAHINFYKLDSTLEHSSAVYVNNWPPMWVQNCRIDTLCFLDRWHKRRLNQVLVLFGLVCVYVCSF